MSQAIVDRWIAALARLEEARELDDLVALFGEHAEVASAAGVTALKGREGARAFWQAYRDTFDTVKSTYRNVVVGDGVAALEWQTVATGRQGKPIRYDGVTVLEFQGDAITRFRAHFDPHVVGAQQGTSGPGAVVFHRESEDLVREIP